MRKNFKNSKVCPIVICFISIQKRKWKIFESPIADSIDFLNVVQNQEREDTNQKLSFGFVDGKELTPIKRFFTKSFYADESKYI